MAAKKKNSAKTTTVAKSGSTDATVKTAVKKAVARKTSAKKAATSKTTAKKRVSKKVTVAKAENNSTTAKTTTAKKKAVAKKAKAPTKTAAKTAQTTASSTSKTPVALSGNPGEFKTFVPYEPSAGEEYMNEEQSEHFRAILLSWKVSLMEEVDRTVGHMKSDATNFPDPNDRATQEEEFSLELRTRDRERKLIKKIDESISKLDDEEYGYCDGCGVEIGIRRLEARPTANMCIECKTLEEIREKQIA